MEQTSRTKNIRPLLYIAGLIVLFTAVFAYIFNPELDLNGDNAEYYVLATSIARGDGYSNITAGPPVPSNVFPPGYPLLMSAVRVFSDSIFPQKVLNGLFLLASALLFFFFLREKKSDALAFTASAVILLNYQVLHFATMMMSEMSFLFFTVLSLFLLFKMDDDKPFWKDPCFYLAILTTAYCYHIRTQGIAFAVAVSGFFLFSKRWKEMLAFGGGFVLCLVPWMLRNKFLGMGQSRYLDMVSMANPWRPEEGALSVGEVISRFFETFKMLLTKAMPDSIIPYLTVDYDAATTLGEWGIALILLGLIVLGMWHFGKFGYLFFFYALATFGVISLFSTPSGNRYITALLPFLEVSLITGLYVIFAKAVEKTKISTSFFPCILVVFLLFSYSRIHTLHTLNNQPLPPAYTNYFAIAEEVKKHFPPTTVVVSRKPTLFYMFSKTAVNGYAWTEDENVLISGLIDAKTDFVVLDQLGYASTVRYLYPVIQKNPELFPVVMYLPDPETYLLKFEREKAIEKFRYKTSHD